MATDADLSAASNIHSSKRRERIELMACTEQSKGWPRSLSEVSIDLLDAYMDHAVDCAYHAELMLLDQQEMEEKLRALFRLARGLEPEGQLLQGATLVAAIVDNDRRLERWKREREATNFPFNHIALYNGVRQIASCGLFFDFSSHESINELDTKSGLQIRGIYAGEQQDVLLGSYALAGVRHDGEERVLPLMNGYRVGLRVIRLAEKTFAIGFRCVGSEMMDKSSYLHDFTCAGADCIPEIKDDPGDLLDANPFGKVKRLAPVVWSESVERSSLAVVNCGRTVRCRLESQTKSFFTAFTQRPNTVQLGATLLLVALLLEGAAYLQQLNIIYCGQQIAEASILSIVGRRAPSEKVGWVSQPSDKAALLAQSLFLYSDSDLVQMLTVEKLIAGASYQREAVSLVSGGHHPAYVVVSKQNKEISFTTRYLRHRFAANRCGIEPQTSSKAMHLSCRARRGCNAPQTKAPAVAADTRSRDSQLNTLAAKQRW